VEREPVSIGSARKGPLSHGQHPVGEVNPRHIVAPSGELQGHVASAGADVQHSIPRLHAIHLQRLPAHPLDPKNLQPTYLPAGFRYSAMVSSGQEPFKLVFYSDDQFVAITQSKAPADRPLPAG